MNRIAVMLLMPTLLAVGAAAAEAPSNPPEPPPRQNRPEHGGRAYWRLFSEMSPEERKAMRELQERDPEEYTRVMKEKVQMSQNMIFDKNGVPKKVVDGQLVDYGEDEDSDDNNDDNNNQGS